MYWDKLKIKTRRIQRTQITLDQRSLEILDELCLYRFKNSKITIKDIETYLKNDATFQYKVLKHFIWSELKDHGTPPKVDPQQLV